MLETICVVIGVLMAAFIVFAGATIEDNYYGRRWR